MKYLNNKIILGSAQFSGNYGISNVKKKQINFKKINQLLLQNKVNKFDTAPFYKDASKHLKKILTFKSDIYTKIKYKSNHMNPNLLVDSLINHKNELNIKNFEGVYIHDFEINNENNFKYLNNVCNLIKESRLTNNFGFSIYQVNTLNFLLKNIKIDILQLPINIFNRSFISYLPKIKKNFQIKIFARSVFLQGVLIKPPLKIYRKDKFLFDSYKIWLENKKLRSINACLGFINQNKWIDHIIIGVDNFDQLKEILTLDISNFRVPKKLFSNQKEIIDPRCW